MLGAVCANIAGSDAMDVAARERFVVVGASGFIGRALMQRLRRENADVIGMSRRAGDDARDVQIRSYDDADSVADAIGAGCDTLFHLAAIAHRRDVEDAAFVRANVDTALCVARAAIARRVRRFVFVSSIGVIGNDSGQAAFDETTTPAPSAAYARSKWQAERALHDLLVPAGIDLVIVRPPLVHGPAAPGNFGRLMALARRRIALPLGSIDNGRSLVGIDNLVDFLLAAARHPSAPGHVLLVTDGEDISTPDLVRRLSALSGRRAMVFAFPPALLELLARIAGRRDMMRQLIGSLRVDAARSAALLGWTPPVSLDEGLARAMAGTR
jgi:nucleoside-diphosphate-sugar epimerase